MTPSDSPLAHLFETAQALSFADIAPQALLAAMQCCEDRGDYLPSREQAMDVFKDVPVKWIDVPTCVLADVTMSMGEFSENFASFAAYHAWYIARGDMPTYPRDNRWPSIASNTPDEVLHDGWHRMHAYVRDGHECIPVIEFDWSLWEQAISVWEAKKQSQN